MKIILLGPPGAGKGTFGQLLEKDFKIPKISTGDIFREIAKQDTKVGKEVNELISKGNLVPDDLTIKIVKNYLRGKEDFILDGFPRTIKQAETLSNIDTVIYLETSEKVILERLSGRLQCENCHRVYNIKTNPPKVKGICDLCNGKLYVRTDEAQSIVRDRIKIYNKETKPLIKYYNKKGLLRKVDANRPLEAVYSDIKKLIKS